MGTPEQNPEAYRRADPITWAEQLSVPLLVVHGTGDDNVHPQNTLRLARALTEAGRPFAMHLYPNRTHALEGTETRIDLFRRLGAFFLARLGPSAEEPASPREVPLAPFPLDSGLGPP
jgi:dipeptidyl-peptidase-4